MLSQVMMVSFAELYAGKLDNDGQLGNDGKLGNGGKLGKAGMQLVTQIASVGNDGNALAG